MSIKLSKQTGLSYLKSCLLILVVVLPFHTFLTVWAADNFGHLYLFSAWKEILLFSTMPVVFGLGLSDKKFRLDFLSENLTWAILFLTLFYAILAGFDFKGTNTLIGLSIGLRFFYAYVLARVVGYYEPNFWRVFVRWLIVAASIISILAILQLLLPQGILQHFGYDTPGTNTTGIPPAYHLSGPGGIERAQSTLRGPNVLGAYLITPIILSLILWRGRNKYILTGLFTIALTLTLSRSAWLAIFMAILAWLLTFSKDKLKKYWLPILTATIASIFLIIQIPVFRANVIERGISNEGHISALKEGTKDVIKDPLGDGPGTAGPASALEGKTPRISENYFLQVGQETGVLGLFVFTAVILMVLYHFWLQKNQLGVALLFSLIALTITNLVLHTWADEAVALSWWALAGLGWRNNGILKKN